MAPSSFRFILLSIACLALFAPVKGAPTTSFQRQNGLDAQTLNAQFASLKATDSCTDGDQACVESAFAQCIGGTWKLSPCSSGLTCVALPLVNKPGTAIGCDTEADAKARMQAAGVDASITGNASTDSSFASNNGSSSAASSASSASVSSPTSSSDDADSSNSDCDMTPDNASSVEVLTFTPASTVRAVAASVTSVETSAVSTSHSHSASKQSNTPSPTAASTIFLNQPDSVTIAPSASAVSSVAVAPAVTTIKLDKRDAFIPMKAAAPKINKPASPQIRRGRHAFRAAELKKRQLPTVSASNAIGGFSSTSTGVSATATGVSGALSTAAASSTVGTDNVTTVTVMSVVIVTATVTATPTPSSSLGLASGFPSAVTSLGSVVPLSSPSVLPPLFSATATGVSGALSPSSASFGFPTVSLSGSSVLVSTIPSFSVPSSSAAGFSSALSSALPSASVTNVVGAAAPSSSIAPAPSTIFLNNPGFTVSPSSAQATPSASSTFSFSFPNLSVPSSSAASSSIPTVTPTPAATGVDALPTDSADIARLLTATL